MSYLFADPNSLTVDTAARTAVPLSYACWFKVSNITTNHTLMAIVDKDADTDYFTMTAAGAFAGDPLRAGTSQSGNTQFANSSIAYTPDVWQHGCAVFAAANDRRVYLNGGNLGTEGSSITPANLDRTAIGRLARLTSSGTALGRIAYAAIWSIALSGAEAAALASGALPTSVQPGSLVNYWDLFANPNDGIGALNMTVNGATLDGDNPSVGVTPTRPRRVMLPQSVQRAAVR